MPQKLMEKRKETDDLIKYDVAFQMISGVCYGGLVRRRTKLLKQAAKDRLQRAQKMIAGGRDISLRVSKENQSKARRAKAAPAQDEAAKKNLWVWADDPETGPIKTLCCKLAKFELKTGSQLADIAEEAGFPVRSDGIFELEEPDLRAIHDQSELLQGLFEHVAIIESIKDFIQEVSELAPAYLQLAAQNYGIPIGDQFENLAKVPVGDLKQLLGDPHVMSIMPSSLAGNVTAVEQHAISHDADLLEMEAELRNTDANAPKQDHREKLRKELEVELSDLREKHREQEQRALELNLIIEYTQERASTIESDVEQRRAETRLLLAAKMKSARRGSMLTKAPGPSLPQVQELQSEVLCMSDVEEGSYEHKWWEDPDAGWAKDAFDSNWVEESRSTKSTDLKDFDVASAHRPETAPEASQLPGFIAEEEGWLVSEVNKTRPLNATDEDYAAHRPFTAPEGDRPSMDDSDQHPNLVKLEETIQIMQVISCKSVLLSTVSGYTNLKHLTCFSITQADIDRLQRLHAAGTRELRRQKEERLAILTQSSPDEAAVEHARARR